MSDKSGENSIFYIHGGKTLHPKTYSIWKALRQRCSNPKHAWYKNYGGRGIKVCDRWNDFTKFLEDVSECPGPNYQIDRIDNDGDYEPGNCRWVTAKENSRNRRVNRYITLEGETHCLVEWAEIKNISQKTIRTRLRLGWSEYDAVNKPVKKPKAS